MKKNTFLIVIVLFTTIVFGQQDSNLYFNTYGIFRAHVATFGGDAEIQDASPRVGFKFDYHFGKEDKYKVFFGGEFAINLIDNQVNFEADPNTSDGGFAVLEFKDKKSTFSTRLGYIGVDFDNYGAVIVGKINSVYKDIAGKTDIFNVMSGQASYVYSPEGADGGETGTGRAEGAIAYKASYWKFDLGLQTQMRANEGGTFFDNYAASLRFNITDHLNIGTAYNITKLGPRLKKLSNLQGLGGKPEYLATGITYNKGPLFVSGVYVTQKNGDFINTFDLTEEESIATVLYDGKGYELVGTYLMLENKLKLMAGFNYKKPETDSEFLPKDYRKRFYLLGAQYQFLKFASVYAEMKIEDSVNEFNNKPDNVFLIGLRIDFDRTWSKYVALK